MSAVLGVWMYAIQYDRDLSFLQALSTANRQFAPLCFLLHEGAHAVVSL